MTAFCRPITRAQSPRSGGTMSDVVILVVLFLFFALSFGFVSLCERLR
jgi:hypothetical protein